LVHLGIDIDQFILLTIYPAAAFFAIGFIAKRTKMPQVKSYLLQAIACIAFSIGYFVAVPNGGAQGLAIVLGMFGALLLFMARKQRIQRPEQSV
jgi:RsiW-degrading membrane proteinase PrsW (M82 family)